MNFANANGEMSVAETAEFVKAALLLLTDMLCGRLPDMRIPRKELMRLVALMKRAQEYLRFQRKHQAPSGSAHGAHNRIEMRIKH